MKQTNNEFPEQELDNWTIYTHRKQALWRHVIKMKIANAVDSFPKLLPLHHRILLCAGRGQNDKKYDRAK